MKNYNTHTGSTKPLLISRALKQCAVARQGIASKIGSGFADSISGGIVDNAYKITVMQNELSEVANDLIDTIHCNFTQIRYLGGDSCKYESGLYFYHGNHLSSTQLITDINGSVTQAVLYNPWGTIISEYRADWMLDTIPRYLFNAKEKDEESGLYYFEARYYSSDAGTFQSRDPKFEQYFWLSPYAYCANNPVVFVDPDGRKIVFAKGTTPEFKTAFKSAIQHLNKNKVGGIASHLEKSRTTYYIAETTGEDTRFSPSTQTVYWNPSLGLETDEGVTLSPTTALNHELGHALILDLSFEAGKMKEYNAERNSGSDPDYGTKNERYVITRIEQITAKALGEIKDGQVTRKNHGGIFIETESPTSNQPKMQQIELQPVENFSEPE